MSHFRPCCTTDKLRIQLISLKPASISAFHNSSFLQRFEGGGHNCPYPFDGNGGTIAHAFYPHVGLIHFDEDEDFTDGVDQGRNLLWVATHEFGHALGLPHSDVYEALMYPWYKGYKPDFSLPADDTGAIRALYGMISPFQLCRGIT